MGDPIAAVYSAMLVVAGVAIILFRGRISAFTSEMERLTTLPLGSSAPSRVAVFGAIFVAIGTAMLALNLFGVIPAA